MSISTADPQLITDPLHSPFPIPWQWILETQATVAAGNQSSADVCRSPALNNGRHQYAAYSRIQLALRPQLQESQVTSVLFVENLQTGILSTVMARSPLAPQAFQEVEGNDAAGLISLLIPVSWSADGQRLLARQFEGFFNSGVMSDFAVVWDAKTQRSITLQPNIEAEYSHAILLGWSEQYAEDVLFQTGVMGEETWPIWRVSPSGDTNLARENHGVVYGDLLSPAWFGSDRESNI
ncbi:hypothetical protein FEK30_07310 [Picosynechococcus sp. PCC 11901]|uniref:hypothetical protein n=1 Tax=Picosynechococcus sp. PCC 11901 TaxID=2579791 RepID=UPI0010FBBFF8|nr:hypothetical protein [Picosynechococcus sp. PCC 11901]QCS49257.1 hypothetical protein FEK30_07310 [Picosynechococcus sp. PCC 11901]